MNERASMLPDTSATLPTASTVGVNNLALQSSFPPSFFTLRSSQALRVCAAYARSAVDASSEAKASAAAVDTPEKNHNSTSFTSSVSQPASSHAVDEAAYEEVNLQDMEFDGLDQQLLYPCPCGDLFELSLSELRSAVAAATDCRGWAVASCPACSLRIRVIFDFQQLNELQEKLGVRIIPPDDASLKKH